MWQGLKLAVLNGLAILNPKIRPKMARVAVLNGEGVKTAGNMYTSSGLLYLVMHLKIWQRSSCLTNSLELHDYCLVNMEFHVAGYQVGDINVRPILTYGHKIEKKFVKIRSFIHSRLALQRAPWNA